MTGKIGFSQITILNSDMPVPNQIYQMIDAVPNSNDPALTGSNYFWDYADLEELENVPDTAHAVENVPDIFQLFFNNPFIYPDYVSNIAFRGQDLSLGAINAVDLLNFYRISSSSYEITGFGTELNGTPIPVLYEPKDIVYEFPMNYLDSSHSFAHFEVEIPTLGYWEEDIDRVNEVDGWGVVTTPAGSFEVLRVKTTLNLTDSVYIDLLMAGTTIVQPTRIEYKWIAKNMGVPVLSVTDLGGLGLQLIYLNEIVDDISEFEHEEFVIYPNPVKDMLYLGKTHFKNYRVIDLKGRLVLAGEVHGGQLNLGSLESGNYLIWLDESHTFQITKL